MVEVKVKLSGDISGDLSKFERTVEGSIILSGAAAMAKVFYDEAKLNTSGVRAGGKPLDPPHIKTGTLHNAIYRVFSPERSSELKKVYEISVNKSKAPHFHLIEFGWSRAPAHPYIRPAFDHAQEAIKAGNERMAQRIAEGGK